MSLMMQRAIPTILAVWALVFLHMPAHADGRAIIDTWLESYRGLGATAAEYGRIDVQNDVVSVHELRIIWEIAPNDATADARQHFRIEILSPEIRLTDLQQSNSGYRIAEAVIPEGLAVRLITAPGEDQYDGTDAFQIRYALSGMEAEGLLFPFAPELSESADRPVSRYARFLHYLEFLAEIEAENIVIAEVEVSSSRPGFRNRVKSLEIGYERIKDGNIGLSTIARITEEYEPKSGAAQQASAGHAQIEYRDLITRDFNLGGIVKWLKGELKAGGDMVIMRHSSVGSANAEIKLEEATGRLQLNELVVEDVTLAPQDASPLEVADQLAMLAEEQGDIPTAKKQQLFSVLRALNIGRVSVEDVRGEYEGEKWALGAAHIRNFSLNGLETGVAEAFSWRDDAGQNLSVDRVEISMLGPDWDRFITLSKDPAADTELLALASIPRLKRLMVEGLNVALDDVPPSRIAKFEINQDGHIGPIPTKIDAQLIEADFGLPTDEEVREQLQDMGLDKIMLNAEFGLEWQEQEEDVVVELREVVIDGVGELGLSTRLSGIGRRIIENPQLAHMLMFSLALKDQRMRIADAAFIEHLVSTGAQKNGISESQVRTMMVDEAMADFAGVALTDFGMQLRQSLTEFFENPRRLEVILEPVKPVLILQIMGLARASPERLPELLGATVTAN